MRSGSGPIPALLPDRLNILKPPRLGDLESYQRLLDLLLELEELKGTEISAAALRRWEARARVHLQPQEIDLLFLRPEDEGFSPSALPEERCLNLRKILLRRKGVPV